MSVSKVENQNRAKTNSIEATQEAYQQEDPSAEDWDRFLKEVQGFFHIFKPSYFVLIKGPLHLCFPPRRGRGWFLLSLYLSIGFTSFQQPFALKEVKRAGVEPPHEPNQNNVKREFPKISVWKRFP